MSSPFTSLNSLDPILDTDCITGRTQVSQLAGKVSQSAFTTDDGKNWTPRPTNTSTPVATNTLVATNTALPTSTPLPTTTTLPGTPTSTPRPTNTAVATSVPTSAPTAQVQRRLYLPFVRR